MVMAPVWLAAKQAAPRRRLGWPLEGRASGETRAELSRELFKKWPAPVRLAGIRRLPVAKASTRAARSQPRDSPTTVRLSLGCRGASWRASFRLSVARARSRPGLNSSGSSLAGAIRCWRAPRPALGLELGNRVAGARPRVIQFSRLSAAAAAARAPSTRPAQEIDGNR